MRHAAALLLFVALPVVAAGKDSVWYMAKLAGSKKVYTIDEKPAADPIDEYTCRPRAMEVARIRSGDHWTLGIPKRHPEAAKLLAEAEEFYGRKQYAEAAALYQKMIALDANDFIAHLLYGDTFFFGDHDYAAALAEYRKALAIDAANPKAYFFTANALMRLDRADDARAAVAAALSYDPVYANLYKVLETQPDAFGMRPLVRYRFEPPRGYLGKPSDKGIAIYGGADNEWLLYAICKAVLRNEPDARKEAIGDVVEVEASFEEERACAAVQMNASLNRTRSRLEEAGKKPVTDADVRAAAPPLTRHLVDVAEAGLFDGYVAFEILGQRCPIAALMYPDELHVEVEKYVRRYLVVKK
ncbi:MAG TPA: tetratricopeptide repeat protein [Thermoanaerobaculia bacterium]|nr:tetratricopeptide repeat protein [Thermoanaerobaculia bacterium]